MKRGLLQTGVWSSLSSSRMPFSTSSRAGSELFTLDPPSIEQEEAKLDATTQSIQEWFESPRFKGIKRPYTARDVAIKRGTFPLDPLNPVNVQAKKLFALLSRAAEAGKPVHTLGAMDPVQQSQMAASQEVVYISGWVSSSVLTTAMNEVGPDLADYPYTTVPNQVQRMFKAQQMHDRKHLDERFSKTKEERKKLPYIDYLRPIIGLSSLIRSTQLTSATADGDTGHGGLSSVMKLAKMFGESGASGVHFEDQLHGGKKCGHQGGKVLVPMSEHVSRLISCRMQWDIMGIEPLVIARTDAETGKLISSTADTRDHEFMLGLEVKDASTRPLAEVIAKAEASGATGKEIDDLEAKWMNGVTLVTFKEGVLALRTRLMVFD
jgi:isocitrate lyase